MEIRKLTEDDLVSLAALYKQFWGEESSLEKMRTTFKRLKRNQNYIFLVAEQQNRIVGSVMGIICEELYGDCKPFMVVEDVIVDKHQRRLGIASSLMRELEECAAEHNCDYIIFVTESERTEAHKFYESLGYKSDAYKGFKKRLKKSQQVGSVDSQGHTVLQGIGRLVIFRFYKIQWEPWLPLNFALCLLKRSFPCLINQGNHGFQVF